MFRSKELVETMRSGYDFLNIQILRRQEKINSS